MGDGYLSLDYGDDQTLGLSQGVCSAAKTVGRGTNMGLAQLVPTFIERV